MREGDGGNGHQIHVAFFFYLKKKVMGVLGDRTTIFRQTFCRFKVMVYG